MKRGRENRPHIGFFGRCNLGKSSLINRFLGQEVSIISPEAGTTTDIVRKSIEIPGIGASVVIDTAGIDDTSLIGKKRIEKTREAMRMIDLAIILISQNIITRDEEEVLKEMKRLNVPFVLVYSKADIYPIEEGFRRNVEKRFGAELIITRDIDKNNGEGSKGIEDLKEAIKKAMPKEAYSKKRILDGLVNKGDLVLLITPIDESAPEGRLILPQVQMIRDVLDHEAMALVVKEDEIEKAMEFRPSLVITDSQIFDLVSKKIDNDIPLTSFSILLARLKGSFEAYLRGTPMIENVEDGDRILLLESCTHHSSCEDIGRVKLPRWIREYTNKEIEFDMVPGLSKIQRPIESYAMIIQCGGCMVTQKQLTQRLTPAIEKGVPVSNYGIMIAYLNGIFERATRMFLD